MNPTKNQMEIKIYPPESQAKGAFDNGRITEIKPIGFPQDGPRVPHTGPLFYWAWASAKGYGKIALHPHQAFEIMSYALEGEIGHYDTLGNKSRVKAGGAQVMQTGSGVSHEEETVGDRTEFFQIWFEPNIRKTVLQEPTYREFRNKDFPVDKKDGYAIKSIMGEGAPVRLETEATMQDVTIEPGKFYPRTLSRDRSLAVVVISGKGLLVKEENVDPETFRAKDFIMIHAPETSTVNFRAEADSPLRLAITEVPARVDYPLYRDG